MPAKVLLSGGTGFIGRALLPCLLAEGLEVTYLVRAGSRTKDPRPVGVRLATVDWTRERDLAPLVAQAEMVLHLAGTVAAPAPQGYLDGNLGITRSLARALARHGRENQRVVYVSSLAAAGPCAQLPGLSEDQPPRPVSAYGRAKLASEREMLSLADKREVVILRPAIVYGPGDQALLPLFRAARRVGVPVPGHGRRPVSLLFVGDLARALVQALKRPNLAGQVYFLSDGQAHSWRDLALALARVVGGPARVLPTPWWMLRGACALGALAGRIGRWPAQLNPDKWLEARQVGWLCDSSRARRDLGLPAMCDLEAGLSATVRWYREHGWL